MAAASLPRNFRHIRDVARRPYDAISLGEVLRNTRPDPESLLKGSRWLQTQLPVRFARRIEDFLQLPHVVVSNPQFNNVLQSYLDTFDAVTSFPEIRTEQDVLAFRDLISDHMAQQSNGTKLIADGYRQVRRFFPHVKLDTFLHTFFTSRIACRVLMENHVNMHRPKQGHVGVIRTDISPLSITRELADNLTALTSKIYGVSPEVEFRGNLDCTLDYIPRHVSYMIQETLKNALRATVERHQGAARSFSYHGADMPPVIVEFQRGDVHIIIKISDQGGGMEKHVQQEAWQYGWTTASEGDGDASSSPSQPLWSAADPSLKSALAGFGFGLPLTRLMAQYFGGDVFMQVLPGHGTDMYLILTHLKEGSPSTEADDLASTLERGLSVGQYIGAQGKEEVPSA